jgi:hypothetical protein
VFLRRLLAILTARDIARVVRQHRRTAVRRAARADHAAPFAKVETHSARRLESPQVAAVAAPGITHSHHWE